MGWGWGWDILGTGYASKMLAYSPTALWPINEATETTINCLVDGAQNGIYTGISLGADGIGDGSTSGTWDGVNDYGDLFSTAFRDVFDGDTGGIAFWYYPGSGVWTDGVDRYFFRFYGGAGDEFSVTKHVTANQIRYRALRNSTFVSYAYTVPVDDRSDWLHISMMWNTTQVFCYCNRILVETLDLAQSWGGTLDVNYTLLGAVSKVPASVTNGRMGWFGVFDETLDGTAISDIGTV